MSQFVFVTLLGSMARVEVAYLLFFSAILVLFDNEIGELGKRALFPILTLATILSHYSTTFIFLLVLFLYWLLVTMFRSRIKIVPAISGNAIALFTVFTFFWYAQITAVPFNDAVNFIKEATMNLARLSMEALSSQGIFLGGIEQHPTHKITVIIHDISFVAIGVGVIQLFRNYKRDAQFEKSYLLLTFISMGLLIFAIFLTSVYGGYGPERIFYQLLIFTAPAFIVGCETIGNIISRIISRIGLKLNLKTIVTLSLLTLQFFAGTYMIYQIGGLHYAEFLNTDGVRYTKFYVHDQDIAGGKWLSSYKDQNIQVWSDFYGRQIYAQFDPLNTREGISHRSEVDGYIYLRYENVVNGKIDPKYSPKKSIEDISHLFAGKNKIYTNGGSEIYK